MVADRETIERELDDPTTPPERLWELDQAINSLARPRSDEQTRWRAKVFRNPNLPLPALRSAALHADAYEAPWWNPSMPLLLLGAPEQRLMCAAITLFIHPHRYTGKTVKEATTTRPFQATWVDEPLEETRRVLLRHLRRCIIEQPPYKELLAHRIRELFGITIDEVRASP